MDTSIRAIILGFILKSKFLSILPQDPYYGSIFVTKFLSRSANISDLNYCLNAMCQSAIETGQILLVNVALTGFNILLYRISKVARRHHWNRTEKLLSTCGSCMKYGIFAIDAIENGIVPTTSAIAAGASAQTTVEFIGKRLMWQR